MKHLWIFALLLPTLAVPNAGAAGMGHPAKGQTAPPIHVNVRLVNVFVNVTDAHGAPVPGLTQKDFALSEDGHPQKITYF
ncbi:MAG TPA: hypothetical protein VFT88_12145, partial [Acidobacteriaceae bacterium]|nr:hypothetical protein [Acidobacteriaceae bacterium]